MSQLTMGIGKKWNLLTFVFAVGNFVGGRGSTVDNCQYSFNVWEPDRNMLGNMQKLEIKYANLSNYVDKELLRLKYSTLSDVQHFQNWTSNLERILTDLKTEQVKEYSDVHAMREQLHRYETSLKEFGNRVDNFVFHYTSPRPIRRKHSRKDRMVPAAQSDHPENNMLMSTLKNMVSDLKSEWFLMMRDIIALKKDTGELKNHQTALSTGADDIRTVANHAESVCESLKSSHSKAMNDMSSFKSDLDNVKQDLSGLRSNQASLRRDVLTTKSNLDAIHASALDTSRYWHDKPQAETITNIRHGKNVPAKDCADIVSKGYVTSGVYQIQPSSNMPLDDVYCEIINTTGYTVIQRRTDGLQSFNRGWLEYRFGFGNLYGSFWIGNELIHSLTKDHNYGLRIDVWDWEGHRAFAEYDLFAIEDEASKYKLRVRGYHGDAGDSFSYHDGMKFSTIDSDNDLSGRNCAVDFKGGWWYGQGYFSQLNGIHHVGMYSATQSTFADGIVWYTLKDSDRYSLRKVEMKLKRNV